MRSGVSNATDSRRTDLSRTRSNQLGEDHGSIAGRWRRGRISDIEMRETKLRNVKKRTNAAPSSTKWWLATMQKLIPHYQTPAVADAVPRMHNLLQLVSVAVSLQIC